MLCVSTGACKIVVLQSGFSLSFPIQDLLLSEFRENMFMKQLTIVFCFSSPPSNGNWRVAENIFQTKNARLFPRCWAATVKKPSSWIFLLFDQDDYKQQFSVFKYTANKARLKAWLYLPYLIICLFSMFHMKLVITAPLWKVLHRNERISWSPTCREGNTETIAELLKARW